MAAQSNSSANVSAFEKLRYAAGLFRARRKMASGEAAARADLEELTGYIKVFEQRTGKRASQSDVVEVGFGARPRRAFMLTGFFRNVYAIDLDAPILTTLDVLKSAKRNGIERAVKSLARHLLFDRREWPLFHSAIARALPNYNPDSVRFIVGSAASDDVWRTIGNVDLVMSFDVFEHIPKQDLSLTLSQIRAHLLPDGLVIARPCVFTGIFGGHNLEWYADKVDGQDSAGAWSHLLDPHFRVNTYLNRLSRRDYCRMFAEAGFSILHDHARRGRFGERHLTSAAREKLAEYDEYELFSNEVEFYLALASSPAVDPVPVDAGVDR